MTLRLLVFVVWCVEGSELNFHSGIKVTSRVKSSILGRKNKLVPSLRRNGKVTKAFLRLVSFTSSVPALPVTQSSSFRLLAFSQEVKSLSLSVEDETHGRS